MEWPKQNTGRFAVPSCVQCCEATPEPADVVLHFLSGDIPDNCLISATYDIDMVERDPETGVIATGTVTWTAVAYGFVGECLGCYGSPCYDGEGNPTGAGDTGFYTYTRSYEFYVTSEAEHGIAEDVLIRVGGDGAGGGCFWAGNWPDCAAEYSSEYFELRHTFIW